MSQSIPIVFECRGHTLVGIVERAETERTRGVLIVVGGPQYRVGSHRQFVLLARAIASAGFATLRFDHRGVGDSDGNTTFEDLAPDINAAINALFEHCPGLEDVVLLGLCDAASAILMYAPTDPRVVGLVALNPWVRSDQTLAQSYLSGYYLAKLKDPVFWRGLFSGKVRIAASISAFFKNVARAKSSSGDASDGVEPPSSGSNEPFQTRMIRGMQDFPGNILFILSEKDLTADEFRIFIAADRRRQQLLKRSTVRVIDCAEADHTFSTARWKKQVTMWTIDWLRT